MAGDQRARGLRTLVVGASSGIGRELARQLVDCGARVAAAARRLDRLAELADVTALCCDVRDPAQCERVVDAASDRLEGLDALVYATGLSKITPLDRSGIDDWQAVFETNVFGAALVTRAALPHLTARGSQGRAVFLSSDSADLAFPGLVAYSASKAALGRFCQGLADERPALRVSEVVVGPTSGTEVADGFDPADFQRWAGRWFEGGYVRHGMQQPADVVAVIVDALLAASPPARVMAAGPTEAAATTMDEGRRQAARD
jgi:NAD(P)-dependent dehydrogenase (short-subunit alcohol dehydrogenase family)